MLQQRPRYYNTMLTWLLFSSHTSAFHYVYNTKPKWKSKFCLNKAEMYGISLSLPPYYSHFNLFQISNPLLISIHLPLFVEIGGRSVLVQAGSQHTAAHRQQMSLTSCIPQSLPRVTAQSLRQQPNTTLTPFPLLSAVIQTMQVCYLRVASFSPRMRSALTTHILPHFLTERIKIGSSGLFATCYSVFCQRRSNDIQVEII